MAEKGQTKQPAKASAPRTLLRRMDQAAVAALVALSLAGICVYWFIQGGHRGELIEIDRAEPLTARYLVDINKADWPDQTRLKLLSNLIFEAGDLPALPHDSRATPGIDRAAKLLEDWLAGAPLPYREIMRRGRRAGLSKASFDRAKRRLGILHDGGRWSLPEAMAV